MSTQTKKLDESLITKIRELNTKKNELIVSAGQLHLNIKQLKTVITAVEYEFENTDKELSLILSDLEQQYPNGEIDLIEGVVLFQE
jgi:hypothetical protein